MAKSTTQRKATKETRRTSSRSSRMGSPREQSKTEHKPPSWAVMKSILTCKHLEVEQQTKQKQEEESSTKKIKKMRCSGSLCNNTKVMHRPTAEQQQSMSPDHALCRREVSASSSSQSSSSSKSVLEQSMSARSFGTSSSAGRGSLRGTPFRRLSGCYECRMVVDPVLGDPSLRATLCSCPQCGEVFMKPDYLELHQATRHAVSELGPEDTSRNIVEIIFQSSWLRKQPPVCKIDRILKVHNTTRTVARFEEYRDSIKARAATLPKKHPRCIADGNELLRFHCTTLMCSLGLNASSTLCNFTPGCSVCSIIRDGFKPDGRGILTTATSGRAHDCAGGGAVAEPRRAMLVCRVIAGRVKKAAPEVGGGDGGSEECDSVAGLGGVYSDFDELYVHNPKAILPCFVVIYRGF